MASAVVLLWLLAVGVGLTAAEVYKVGDSAGWTIEGNPNYAAWASSKTFHVGDIIVFEYNNQYHNVLQVSRACYHECNIASPLASHATGNDSISVQRTGHLYFICGFPGHCGLGQKVDIRIPKNGSSTALPSTTHFLP